jgi:type IV pilus assembly protein PilX
MNAPTRNLLYPRRDRGAALIVALLLLLVMTILGVTTMNSSIMQGFMSASYQQQTSTLAGVENVVFAGERDVEAIVDPFGVIDVGDLPYFIDLTDPALAGTSPWVPSDTSTANWSFAQTVAQTIGALDIFGQYRIEYMGEFEVPGESIAEGGGLEDSRIHIFRISARGAEEDGRGALRVVQTLYVTLRGPDLG